MNVTARARRRSTLMAVAAVLAAVLAPLPALGQTFPVKPIRMIVPTVAEQGFPGFEVSSAFGMLGPAGLPPAVVKALNTALVKALQDPTVRERLSSQGADPIGSTPEAHDQYIRSEIVRWQKIVQKLGIKIDQ